MLLLRKMRERSERWPIGSELNGLECIDDTVLVLLCHLVKERQNESSFGDAIGDRQSGFPMRGVVRSLSVDSHDGAAGRDVLLEQGLHDAIAQDRCAFDKANHV